MSEDRHQRQRSQILRAAAKAIADRGLPDTRMADVAKEIGVTPPSLLHYFPTKDALLAEALSYADQAQFERVQHELAKQVGSMAQLAWFINHNLNIRGSARDGWRQDWNLWIEVWARALHDGVVASARRQQDARWRKLVTDIVANGQTSGEFVQGSAEEFALLLRGVMDGLAVQLALRDPGMTRRRAVAICLDLVTRHLVPSGGDKNKVRQRAP